MLNHLLFCFFTFAAFGSGTPFFLVPEDGSSQVDATNCATLASAYNFNGFPEGFEGSVATLTVNLMTSSEYPDDVEGSTCFGTLSIAGQAQSAFYFRLTHVDNVLLNEGMYDCVLITGGEMECFSTGEVEANYEEMVADQMAADNEEEEEYVSATVEAMKAGTWSIEELGLDYELEVGDVVDIHNMFAKDLRMHTKELHNENEEEYKVNMAYADELEATAATMTTQEHARRFLRKSGNVGKFRACKTYDKCIKKFEKAVDKLMGQTTHEEQKEREKYCKKPPHKRGRNHGISCCGRSSWWGICIPAPDCCGKVQIGWDCYSKDRCPPGMSTCGLLRDFCDKSGSGVCTEKDIGFVISLVDIAANIAMLAFTGPAAGAVKTAVTTGAKAIAKQVAKGAVRGAMRAAASAAAKLAKAIAKNLASNLRKHLKKAGKELKKELKDDIKEEMLMLMQAKEAKDKEGITMGEVAAMLDPTGIVHLVQFLDEADQCVYPISMSADEFLSLEGLSNTAKAYDTAPYPMQNLGGSGCSKSNQCLECQGDCDNDSQCMPGLWCFQRDGKAAVPGCRSGGSGDVSNYDYCYDPVLAGHSVVNYGSLENLGKNGCSTSRKCGQCEGDCDKDSECRTGLKCFQRSGFTAVPGCAGQGVSNYDYCYDPNHGKKLLNLGGSGCTSSKKCGKCQGDCDNDSQCQPGLKCFQRDGKAAVPGCQGGGDQDVSNYDYCIPTSMYEEALAAEAATLPQAESVEAMSLSEGSVLTYGLAGIGFFAIIFGVYRGMTKPPQYVEVEEH